MSAKVTAKAVSQVQNQLPAFISDEFPLYQKFMEHYYEFMESLCVYYTAVTSYGQEFTVGETATGLTSGATATVKATGAVTQQKKLFLEPTNDINFVADEIIEGSTSSARVTISSISRKPLNATKTFKDLVNSDETSVGLLEAFKKELYPNIRNSATGDLRKFIKHLKEFYRSKGSEKSFRTLFRLLWGQENLDFYYPKDDLLKLSDGNWQQDTVLQLSYDVTYLDYNGLTITGRSSGATGFVSKVTTRKLGTIPIIELVLTNRSTIAFSIGEEITATTAAGTVITATVTGQMTDITISDGGTGYDVGDTITISDSSFAGFGAAATVSSTTADQVTIATISNGGNGFQVNDPLVFDNTGTNVDVTAEAKVGTLSGTYTVDVITTKIAVAVKTKSFNVAGASSSLPFSVTVLSGYLVGNDSTYANSTKKGEVVSISNSELRVYDFANETTNIVQDTAADEGDALLLDSTDGSADAGDNIMTEETVPAEWVNGDTLYLFNDSEVAISGATAVTISDSTITNPTDHLAINTSDYGTDLNGQNRNSTFTSAMTSETQTFGRIATITISSHGSGYESIPTVTIENDYYADRYEPDSTNGGYYGRNSVITIGALGGTMTGVNISEEGFGYIDNPSVTAPVNSTAATLVPVMTAIKTKPGVHIGESGMLSSGKKVQNNDYYQDFSYVLKTTDSIDVWKQDVLKLLHPAGMKLFGEVAITTDLNGRLFDRGLNNINSLIENVAQYRDLSLEFITTVLRDYSAMIIDSTDGSADAGDNLLLEDAYDAGNILNEVAFRKVTAESEMNREVEVESILNGAFAKTSVMMEDGSLLKYEDGYPIGYEQYFVDTITESIIEYLQILLASGGYPAEMFSLMSVKDVSGVSSDPYMYLEYATDEEGGALLNEDGDNMLAEEARTTIVTSNPHYFHSGDLVYLDEFEGTGLEGINGSTYKVSDVDIVNSKLILDSTDGSADAGDGIILENDDFGYLRNEEIASFTLSDSTTESWPHDTDTPFDDFDISSATITTNGKVFRPGREMTAGIPNALLRDEYIGEYSSYVIDNYEHNCPADFSSLVADTVFLTRPRHLSIESNILIDSTDGSANAGDDLLLEDGTANATSAIGKILMDDGVVDIDATYEDYELVITEGQEAVVHTSYITDEDIYEDDRIILEDVDNGGKIVTEESIVRNGVIPFDRPFHYKGHPYENNNGFLYYNHKIDQRVSV